MLLTARALELENVDRDLSRESVMEAIKLAPTLVPAAVLASKFESEAHQVRRSMRIVETAWLAQPHPDLADAYAHVKLGDSARQRLVRVETLAAKAPGHIEGALAIARAAIDASEFARAREALAPFIARADAARRDADGGDRAHRARRQRPRAGLDPARGARAARSGVDRGRLCLGSLAAGVAGNRAARCVPMADAAGGAAVRQGRRDRNPRRSRKRCWRRRAAPRLEPPKRRRADRPAGACAGAGQFAGAGTASARTTAAAAAAPAPAPPAARRRPPPVRRRPPLFRARQDIPKAAPRRIPAVIPIVRAPDDPGIDDEAASDEFAEQIGPPKAQAGGWRGFLSRWGS